MKSLIILIFILLSFSFNKSFAQEKVKIVIANSPKVAIKDGDEGVTKYWNHLVNNKLPIVYNLAKNQKARPVTFYTDIDSISFNVTSNASYPFKVVLNKKDTILITLSTATTEYVRLNSTNDSVDIIPFVVNKHKQIVFKGSINNCPEIDFVFDLGARITYLIGSNLAEKNKLVIDGLMEDESVTGLSTEKTSSKNRLTFGNIKVENTPICYIDEAGFLENGGGLIGFNIFQGKILEIDFDNQLLLIHNKLPGKKSEYSQLTFKQTTGGLYIPITVNNGIKESVGWYFFDTGADNALAFDLKYAKKENLTTSMKKIGDATIASSEKRTVKATVLEVPKVQIANFTLENVPTILAEESNAEAAFEDGVVGIGLQKRFNMILDYSTGIMYLKPSKYFEDSFKKKDNEENYFITVGCLIAFILLSGGLLIYKRSRKIYNHK